ncbi:MAG: Flp pilus assembly complex ATPase component TadA [Firmicutes bacterium]|nr:Flp pilus assembly complex ATPase component TadA [Bacillota bacterium]
MANRFYLTDYLKKYENCSQETSVPAPVDKIQKGSPGFMQVCQKIRERFDMAWQNEYPDMHTALNIQKKAIIGYENEVSYFLERIRGFVKEMGFEDTEYPQWYESLESGIYHENWGLCGLAEWFEEKYAQSSSAKIIGDRVYFLHQGRMVLQPQKINLQRRQQMVRAFLLGSPEERMDSDVYEVYLLDGTRVTVFRGSMTKHDQDVMIFRRYVLPVFTFDEQVARGTIPKESPELFRNMVKLGYNVVFSGAVRTSKSSFLSTWQSYEDPCLEGVMVETDPEIRMHKLMPDAPVVQLLADGKELEGIVKRLLRSDADYFIIAEARDGIALDTAVKTASKGNRRLKMTFHERQPCDFCHDAAAEIVKSLGGDLKLTARAVAKSFDYIFHFVQLRDKSQKRLKSIYEITFDEELGRIVYRPVLQYDVITDSWKWFSSVSLEKVRDGMDEDAETFKAFRELLMKLGGGKDGEAIIREC